jgi:PAS domain S-box-containing protein
MRHPGARALKWPEQRLSQAHAIHRVAKVNAHQIAQLSLLLGLAFSVLLAIPFLFYYRAESDNNLSLLQAEQDRVIKLAAGTIHLEMDAVLSDLRYLSQHNEIKSYLSSPGRNSSINLATEYQVLARQKRLYDQIRFIGLDGMEEVRVNFNEGKPEIVAGSKLQDKHGRYYFEEALWLAPGQIYVSPLDLNIEQGSVDQPSKPVMRFATPVADDQGLIRGIVVLNYFGQRLREKLNALEGLAGNRIRLLNAQGYWLMGPTPEDEWGFIFPERAQRRLDRLSPLLWQQIRTEYSGTYRAAASWIKFERIYPLLVENPSAGGLHASQPVDADRYFWTIVVELPHSAMQAANIALLKQLLTIYGALALFAFLVAGALAFAISRNRTLSQVMEKVVDNVPVLVAYVDADRRYRFNNMAYEQLFGLQPGDIYGKTMRAMLGETAYRAVQPYIEQALAGKTVAFEQQLAYARTGMRDVAISYLPDFSPQGDVRGFYVMINDITLIKESERLDRQRMLELAHVSRLASMGEMATEIAHEINQPLAAISMYSAAGLRTLQDDSGQMKSWLEAINTQAKRASEIVRRMRRFVRKDEPRFGPVDMNSIAREVASLLNHEAKSQGVDVVLELAEDLPSVQGERVLLEQVVFNLARNAMDAVLSQPGERRITLRTSSDAQLVYVEVSDTGPGVDPALGEKIFDSFVTSKQGNLGMGLTISRSIIEAHAGTLRYVTKPGAGNAFLFSLACEAQR